MYEEEKGENRDIVLPQTQIAPQLI